MADTDRRGFLKATGAALAGAALGPGCAPATDGPEAVGLRSLSRDLLRSVAEVVLPSAELGGAGVEEAVVAFEAWLAGFEPVAELDHGYGTSEIQYGPPDPAPGWEAQLRGLDLESRHRFDLPFTGLPLEQRRQLVAGHLSGAPERLPLPGRGPHVALGLLAHFYDSPGATDLCYGRSIGKLACRGIASAAELPAPLAPTTGRGG